MYAELLIATGGVGLFLLGMIILTAGIREAAGGALRRMLARFTRTPLRGVAAGAVATAVVQSSSATTVMAIGFVSAGTLTFPQGLGIVFGANIGTTVTGWMVALLGFKFSLGTVVAPLLFAGVLMRLFGGPRLGAIGWALAGFSALFLGIEAMQEGMSRVEGLVTPADFPDDDFLGRVQLVLIGVAITVVTQSSSAGVAVALAVLSAGAITFAQAAAMVIGMNVGTTFTAALATLGGSTAMRRTGFGHVAFNVMTSLLAFVLLDPFANLFEPWIANGGVSGAQFSLVGFHTAFNVLGVALILPFAKPFSRLIALVVRERGPQLTRRLDDQLLDDTGLAIAAAAATARDIMRHMAGTLEGLLRPGRRRGAPGRLMEAREALDETRRFVDRLRTDPSAEKAYRLHVSTMHMVDHLLRLAHRCGQHERIEALQTEHRLRRLSAILREACELLLAEQIGPAEEERLNRIRLMFQRRRLGYRERMVDAASQQAIDTETTLQRLDAIRWLHRVVYHLWRVAHHANLMRDRADPDAKPEAGLVEVEED